MILDELNDPQREAVTAGAGPLMVLAGAGSGKTRVLTHRLAQLISVGEVEPWQIMAVTFTNKAARQMRERVAELVGQDVADQLWISTFHGAGSRILRRDGEALGISSNFTILDSGDQQRLVKRVVDAAGFKSSEWTPRRLANTFSRWKDDGLLPKDVGAEQGGSSAAMLAGLYEKYETALHRTGCLDFGDLLLQCLTLFARFPDVLQKYQRRFHYVLVDEYQDTNAVQFKWLKLLAAGYGNLCVVGDDDQSIYGWRGARLDNILDFSKDYPNVRVVRLEQNYRSTGNILKAAEGVISHNRGRMGKKLWTEAAPGVPVKIYQATNGDDEAYFAVRQISRLYPGGDYQNVAILVRTTSQTRAFEFAFGKENIGCQVVGGLRFLDRAEVKDALAYLRIALSHRDDLAFTRVVNLPRRGLGARALALIEERARSADVSLLEAARQLLKSGEFKGVGKKGLQAFVELIDGAHQRLDDGEAPAVVVDFLLDASGYRSSFSDDERRDDREANLKELLTVLDSYDDVTAFLNEAALVADLGEDGKNKSSRRVIISTLHAAKGLEFPVVFLAGMEEGLLPHKRVVEESGDDGLEEERRLVYVGMTRARERLFITHARRRRLFDRTEPAIPSRFLREVPQEALENSGSFAVDVRRSKVGKRESHAPAAGSNWMQEAAALSNSVDSGPVGSASGPWSKGSHVVHDRFGEGIVRGYVGSGPSQKIMVYFLRTGMKTLVMRLAGLKEKS